MTEEHGRMESGAVAFGSDWPGLFLRGDDSIYYGYVLHKLLVAMETTASVDSDAADPEVLLALINLPNLVKKLQSVDVQDPLHEHVQLREARECLESAPTLRGPGPEDTPEAKIEIR